MYKDVRKSFTLIELLVVVAIIGILMTMLLPALSNARAATKSAVCKSNQKNMYLAYMLHSDDGYIPSIDGDPFGLDDAYGHKPGQLIHTGWISKRLKIMVLELDDREAMNCPEYSGSGSSFGFNVEENNCHSGQIDVRMYFSHIISPVEFVMMGDRESDGEPYWLLERSASKLAQHHPKNSGNLFCADGHVISTTRFALDNPQNNPSFLNQ